MCSVIIVDYHSMKRTIEYIQHLIEQLIFGEKLHIVIVDNSECKDGLDLCCAEYGKWECLRLEIQGEFYVFRTNYATIVYCYSGGNLGYAKGNNLGTEVSDKFFSDDYYLISNNDLKISQKINWDYVKNIFETKPNIAVIGPRVVGIDGKEQSPHKKIKPFKHLVASYWIKYFPVLWRGGDYDYTGESKVCYRVMGCFMFVRANMFRKVGRFDAHTFMYAEELILSERLLKKNWYFYFENTIKIIHEHGATVKQVASVKKNETWSFESLCYYYQYYRNTNTCLIEFAKINFKIYVFCLPVILKVKECRNKTKRKFFQTHK